MCELEGALSKLLSHATSRILPPSRNGNIAVFCCVMSCVLDLTISCLAVAEMTVRNDGNFWSSTGSPHDIGEEFILYKLKHPLSIVRAVVVQVYRATFQGGCAPFF